MKTHILHMKNMSETDFCSFLFSLETKNSKKNKNLFHSYSSKRTKICFTHMKNMSETDFCSFLSSLSPRAIFTNFIVQNVNYSSKYLISNSQVFLLKKNVCIVCRAAYAP